MDAVIAPKSSCNRSTWKPRAQVLMDVGSSRRKKNFWGKDQQRECCNSALLKKQNKTTQNMEQPKHWTDLLNHRHKRIEKYYKTKKLKIHCRRHLVVQGHWIQELLADQPSVSGILCCQEHKRWEYTALTGEELRLKDIYPFQINSVIYSNI